MSIIVPVYNVSEYLRECLDSLIHQTLKEIEIIIVNDCSPDPQDDVICREYAEKDDRIVYLVHEKNLRQGGARNTGLREARGEFIGFIDSDDWVDLDMYAYMYEKAVEHDCDLVDCGMVGEPPQRDFMLPARHTQEELLETENGVEFFHLFSTTNIRISSNSVNKLYKRSLWLENDLSFPEHLKYEDLGAIPSVLYFSHRIYLLPNSFYHYRRREGSSTHSLINVADYGAVFNFIGDFLKAQGIYEEYQRRFLKMVFEEVHARRFQEGNPSKETQRKLVLEWFQYLKDSGSTWEYLQLLDTTSLLGVLDLSPTVLNLLDNDPQRLSLLSPSSRSSRWYRFKRMTHKQRARSILRKVVKKLLRR